MSARRAVCCLSLLLAACSIAPTRPITAPAVLEARVAAILERRGLGADALGVIDNMIRHESPAPPHAPPLARELLARPLAAADAAAIFEREVPEPLLRLAREIRAPLEHAAGPPIAVRELIDPYVRELAEAQRLLRAAAPGDPVDSAAILRELEERLPQGNALAALAPVLDAAALQRAAGLFFDATARLVRALRSSRVQFPQGMERFETGIGTVVLGTAGDDRHAPGAALIVDPGGNDRYERAPATGGAISVIVDLAGDDRYLGPDLAAHALSAIVELSGDDRYEAPGPGLGAAIAGAAVILDAAGNDAYEAMLFGEGAAAFGIGAILDLAGDDVYAIRAGGQGLGMAGGLGLLWDRAGNDRYRAAGLPDAFDRGGGVSMAQGTGLGGRGRIGGGIGILRDDAGDDAYEAQMFAQGAGFYYGVGLLWDGGGNDRYRAVRYAQGNGTHEAVGVLRDERGDDRYALAVGVGQGMGLDLSVGLLVDGAGDDRYEANAFAQGAATANGIGVLADAGGADRFRMSADTRAWGRAEWLRGLPSLGLLVYDPAHAVFERDGMADPVTPAHAALGGPAAGTAPEHEAVHVPACPKGAAAAPVPTAPLAEQLDRLLPGLIAGKGDPALFASVSSRLTASLRESLATLPAGAFNVSYALGEALRCTLRAASPAEAKDLWDEIERELGAAPPTPFAGALLIALRARPAPPAQMQRILRPLDEDSRCAVRAIALELRGASVPGAAAHARSALRSTCWRLQAEALAVLGRLGEAPDPAAPLPSFLRPQ